MTQGRIWVAQFKKKLLRCINAAFYGFFPNLPRLSLFFLNLPCCISFFSFPCWGVPLVAVALPPSNFLFLSLMKVKTVLNLCRTSKAATLNSSAPLDAHDSCAARFLQHRLPFFIISTDFVPTNMILISTVIQNPTFPQTAYSLFHVHFFDFLYFLLVSLLKLFSCFLLQ